MSLRQMKTSDLYNTTTELYIKTFCFERQCFHRQAAFCNSRILKRQVAEINHRQLHDNSIIQKKCMLYLKALWRKKICFLYCIFASGTNREMFYKSHKEVTLNDSNLIMFVDCH